MTEIKIAETDDEIRSCYEVIAELRPHITENDFLAHVRNPASGFRIAYLLNGDVKAVAGIRIGEWLAGGRYLEIEDLVTKGGARSAGYGGALFDWIANYARYECCDQLKLVSNVSRFGAHKFYLNKGMIIEAHYFSMKLTKP